MLDKTRTTAHCRSEEDGYGGYVSARHLSFDPAPAPTHFIANLGAYAYRVPDLRAAPLDFLPRHSPVAVAETGIITRGTEYARLDPKGYLPLSCLSPTPPRSPDFIAAAALYLGAPYLWGGRSFLGLDCSGLVQQAFRDLGIAVRRDTDDQRDTIGAAVPAVGEEDLRRGDLIYIPGHVMIYAGAGEDHPRQAAPAWPSAATGSPTSCARGSSISRCSPRAALSRAETARPSAGRCPRAGRSTHGPWRRCAR